MSPFEKSSRSSTSRASLSQCKDKLLAMAEFSCEDRVWQDGKEFCLALTGEANHMALHAIFVSAYINKSGISKPLICVASHPPMETPPVVACINAPAEISSTLETQISSLAKASTNAFLSLHAETISSPDIHFSLIPTMQETARSSKTHCAKAMDTPDPDTNCLLDPVKEASINLLQELLIELLAMVDVRLQQEVRCAVVIVPTYFSLMQIECLKKACEMAGLHIIRLSVCSEVNFINASGATCYVQKRDDQELIQVGQDAVEGEEIPAAASSGSDNILAGGDELWDGLDEVDLPQSDEGEEWLHRVTKEDNNEEAIAWESGTEEEKACCDRVLSSTSTRGMFSKVFGVRNSGWKSGYVSIPSSYKPEKDSPSAYLKSNTHSVEGCMLSTFRMMVQSKYRKGEDCAHYSTGFAVSPTVAMSAKHCLSKPVIVSIKACQGIVVSYEDFEGDRDKLWEAKCIKICKETWSGIKDAQGLFTRGADVGSFNIEGEFPSFLLPCSPSFLNKSEYNKVAILSYPSVDKFMKTAKKELVNLKCLSPSSSIWKVYRPAMQSVIDDLIRETAVLKNCRVEKVKNSKPMMQQVKIKAKKMLYEELQNTFKSFHTGYMLCAVGSIIATNGVAIGTSCSTLRGSSGAAIIPMERPGYFVGIHNGGSKGFDMNHGTSTDSKAFVTMYMASVLPTLPPPDDECWHSRDISGFVAWLHKHVAVMSKNSLWYSKACEGLKRKRK